MVRSRLYELCWQVDTDVHSFCYRELKVFRSDAAARYYGKKREGELNGGLSIEERAQDGFCFRYLDAHELENVDGFIVEVRPCEGKRQ